MARVRCKSCGRPKGTKHTYSTTPRKPVGHPKSGLICGSESCENPGLVWLTEAEDRQYKSNATARTFQLNKIERGVKFRVL